MALGRGRLYDIVYRAVKDYRSEAAKLAALVRARHPSATRLLDVACGTGEHASYLRRLGLRVDGIDIERTHVTIARRKNPGGRFERADMREFRLDRSYDVVACLFGSIAYAASPAGLRRAVRAMARHLERGGLLLIEPWFAPGELQPGRVTALTADDGGVTVSRMSHVEIRGRSCSLRFEYLIGDATGLRRAREHHVLGLFTRPELEAAFRSAGLRAELDSEGLTGRPLYIARAR